MDQPRNGRGALNLLLRLSMLRARQRAGGSLAERGYSLAVALIASFVLLLGVAALASRGQLGFIGQVFQVQNRQARDVAESAIAEFADVMNRERNRHLLIAGTTNNWGSNEFRNICTAVDDATDAIIDDGAGNPVYLNPDAAFSDFIPSNANPPVFIDRGNGRSFRVESIEFIPQNRNPNGYFDTSATPPAFRTAPNGESYGTLYRSGGESALIRITVIGRFTQNNRTSASRVAREFEVVPKCCNRSFGQNLIGGANWGRDTRPCITPAAPGDAGLIAGMGGGTASGSNNNKPIVHEDGTPVTQASCWAGNTSDPSDLTGTPSTTCTSRTSAIGNISFVPTKFSFQAPVYNNPDGAVTPAPVPVNTDGVIFFDVTRFNNGVTPRRSGLVLRRGTSIDRIDGTPADGTATTPDPCYTEVIDSGAGKPYYTVNCLITSIDPTGNTDVFIDTSSAKINMFFAGNGTYGLGIGNAGVFRIHNFRSDLATEPANCGTPSDCLIEWPDVDAGDPITQTDREGTFLELCTDRGGFYCDINNDGDEEYSVRRLLNFYTSGSGTFMINGTSSGLGFNIYAPNATVRMNGGDNADNFMGQIWTNNLIFNGSIKIQTFQAGAVPAPSTFAGIPLIDFIARSFSQSSGF